MTDETQPPNDATAPATSPPVPRITAPLPPRSGQRLDEATAARHDVTHATRPPWPKYDADKPEPDHKRGKRQCIGRSTLSGKRCGNAPCEGKERCKFHGGRTTGRPPKGRSRDAKVVRGKVGRYFESMGKLAQVYQESLADSALTDTREPLAALDAFTRRVLKRADEHDVPEFRKWIGEWAGKAHQAWLGKDEKGLELAITMLLEASDRGIRQDASDAAAIAALKTFSERVDAYWKTKLDRKQAINARDLTLILQRIVDIIQAEVPGEAALRVANAIDTLMIQSGRSADLRDAQDVALIGGPRASE